MEDIMALHGASLWILAGGILALVGGGASLYGALLNNQEQQDMILGGRNTFCQLTTYFDRRTGWYLSTFHHSSGGNIYDVDILVQEVAEDGTPLTDRVRSVVGTMTSNTWPFFLLRLGIHGAQQNLQPRYFQAQVTQRNGTSLQEIVIYPQRDGRIQVGFLQLEFNRRSFQPDFGYLPPRDAQGIAISPEERQRITQLRHAQAQR